MCHGDVDMRFETADDDVTIAIREAYYHFHSNTINCYPVEGVIVTAAVSIKMAM